MSLSDMLKRFYIKVILGMNNKVEDLDLQDKWVKLAQNCRYEDEPGALDKRPPVTYLNSTKLGDEPVVGLKRFYTSSGVAAWVAISGTKAYHISDAGVSTEIRTGLTDGKRPSFETYKDLLLVSNGFDNIWCWDGDTTNDKTWELGACKAIAGTAAGSTGANVFVYAVSIGATTAAADHYVCGALSNSVSAGSAGSVVLSHIPMGPLGTTERKIWRTVAGGTGGLALVGTISDNSTTTYTDTKADGALGEAMPIVSDDMPKGSEMKMHRERLFITRDPSSPNKIYYSNPYLPHYIKAETNLDYLEISPEDNDEIMGIPIVMGTMICIKKNSIRRVHVTSSVSGSDPTTWYADDPISWIGSPAQWSIIQTSAGIMFLGWDHWYRFDGSSVQAIVEEFDVYDILPSAYSSTVATMHNGVLIAAFTDKENAAQQHDRIMRYNFKRQTLSFDLWTSTTITGANCFASRSGDDEVGDLFYGDSQAGYIVKDKETDYTYRLRTKTEALEGTESDVFIGGTENEPYLEIGNEVAADAIPVDTCIFWDQTDKTPGSGWTEITDYAEKFIKFSSTFGTVVTASTHTHPITGTISTGTNTQQNCGDGGAWLTMRTAHTHTISTTSGSSDSLPRYINLKIYKKNATTTETEFPIGAIVMWDQSYAPTGWLAYTQSKNCYIRLNTSDLGYEINPTHNHAVDVYTAYSNLTGYDCDADQHTVNAHRAHRHRIQTTSPSIDGNTLEYNNVTFLLIKKVGESDTWDGLSQYCYTVFASSAAPSGGWAAVTTYNDRYLKSGEDLDTHDATATHTHDSSSGTTKGTLEKRGDGLGYHNQSTLASHTHPYSISYGAGTHVIPSVTFRLVRKIFGQMKPYNASIEDDSLTSGSWTSPAMNINAESLLKLFWNQSIVGSDTILFHTRSGATQVACEAAAWSDGLSDPNGSAIVTTPNVWFQYKIEFAAADTTVSNPRVYFTSGYLTKMTYSVGATIAETSVNFKYQIGFRNFDEPSVDKIFKKLILKHIGEEGSVTVSWETENSSGSFTFSLSSHPKRWESFFQDNAMGREVDIIISKNDLLDYRLSEVSGFYSPLLEII